MTELRAYFEQVADRDPTGWGGIYHEGHGATCEPDSSNFPLGNIQYFGQGVWFYKSDFDRLDERGETGNVWSNDGDDSNDLIRGYDVSREQTGKITPTNFS